VILGKATGMVKLWFYSKQEQAKINVLNPTKNQNFKYELKAARVVAKLAK
jgi:hypothetical protein